MPKKVTVKAASLADPALKGMAKVHKEGTRGRYITEEPVEVELTSYYMRKIHRGELEIVTASKAPSEKPPQKKPKSVATSPKGSDNPDKSEAR